MQYRREIDGLRAVAVLPVILFHAGFELFGGGYIGVDVFFVISGYLITSIILSEQASGQFSLRHFYERRARRILPALIVVVLASFGMAWLWFPPDDLRAVGESTAAVALFLSNFYFWNDVGYFSTAAELRPLLHTWSLAVEEQYYLFAPLLMLLLWPLGLKRMGLVFLGLAMASFLLAEWWLQRDAAAAFFLLPTRAWELLAGALAAVYLWRREMPLAASPRLRSLLAFSGLGLITIGVFWLDGSTPFPGRYALLPVVGTVLVILFASGGEIAGRLLGTRPLVAIGLISYSAYLWHQPLFAFTRMRTVASLDTLTALGLIVLTLVLAALSYRFVEQPFRSRRRFTRRQIARYAMAASLGCVLLGGFGIASDGAPSRLSPAERALFQVSEESPPTGGDCNSFDPDDGLPVADCVPDGDFETRVLVIGDSHTNAIAHGLMALEAESGIGITQFARSACLSVPGLSRSGRMNKCARHSALVDGFIREDQDHDVVILVGRWTLNFEGERFDNREGGVEYGGPTAIYPIGENDLTEDERKQGVSEIIQRHIGDYLALGKRVLLMYPVPEAGWSVPDRMMRKAGSHYPPAFASTSHRVFRDRNRDTLAMLDGIADHPRLARFQPHRLFCDSVVAGRCITQLEGVPFYKDDHHLSHRAGRMVAEQLLPLIRGEANDGPAAETATTVVRDAVEGKQRD